MPKASNSNWFKERRIVIFWAIHPLANRDDEYGEEFLRLNTGVGGSYLRCRYAMAFTVFPAVIDQSSLVCG
jgi:hypothetical protein